MSTKQRMGLVLAVMCGTACAVAQPDEVVGSHADPEQIMGAEAVGIAQTIQGYVQGAKHRGYFELHDLKKGEMVTLRLDRIVLDDPDLVMFPKPDRVAICGECTQVELDRDPGREVKERELDDTYEVWFVLLRGGVNQAKVLDTFIKSVNGDPMFAWHQDAAGEWSATVVPDEP
jgi:hypothetical protein